MAGLKSGLVLSLGDAQLTFIQHNALLSMPGCINQIVHKTTLKLPTMSYDPGVRHGHLITSLLNLFIDTAAQLHHLSYIALRLNGSP